MAFYQLRQYLRYLLHAKTKHGVHSPFVYEFVTKVLPHRRSASAQAIAALRANCSRSSEVLEIEDFGAGYGGSAKPIISKTLNQVTQSSARSGREGALLSRICQRYQPSQVLELGTNLGFSAMYLLSGLNDESQLITIEGSKQLSKFAETHFQKMGYSAQQIVGEFGAVLREQIDWDRFQPQLVLLDGNHRKQATLDYFAFLLPRLSLGAILILDDIYWSREMTEAWLEICAHPRVSVSIDLFAMGICFLDRPQAKEHFCIRFRAW